MKKGYIFILAVLLSVNTVHANTDKTKTELRGAVYTNCSKEVKTNKNITNASSVCSCVADKTINALDAAAFNAFEQGGWDAYQAHIKGKSDIAQIIEACTNSISSLANKNLLSKEMFDKYIKKMQEAKKNGTSGKTGSSVSNEGLLKLFKNNSGKVSLKELLQKKAQQQ